MSDKKLSLTTRKNLRDNEDKKKEQLARIESATGKSGLEFVIKDDIGVAEQLAKNGYQDRMGEIMYDSYLSQLADSLTKLCESEDNKTALGGVWTTNRVVFEIDQKAENYQQVTFVNGDLRMACQPSNIWTNLSNLGEDIPSRLTSAYAGEILSLKSANNLRAHADKRQEYLDAIGAAVGKTGLEFLIKNMKDVDAQLAKNGYENRMGEILYGSYLQQLSEYLTKFCGNEQAKISLNRKWTSNRIVFETDAKAQNYQEVTFPNGDLRMACTPSNIWCNISYLGENIPDLLSSDILGVTLSLKSAQNIREYEEKAAGYLAQIATAIGRAGAVTFVVEDIPGVDAALNKNGYNNRIGEIIWGSYLEQISSKLTSLCGDDMVKEAIGDGFKNNLVFKIDPKAENYQNCKFADGNLVMFCKPGNLWTNISSLGEDIEKQL